ncbi:hypothetical protein FQG56_14180 [Escherichia coli]|nr:hypothetical protein [Escherichia coli]
MQIHHQTLFTQLLKLLFDNGNTETKLMSQLFSRDQSMSPEIAQCIDSQEVRKKPGGHWIIRDLTGLDLMGLASL